MGSARQVTNPKKLDVVGYLGKISVKGKVNSPLRLRKPVNHPFSVALRVVGSYLFHDHF